jgi:hypothetical protein
VLLTATITLPLSCAPYFSSTRLTVWTREPAVLIGSVKLNTFNPEAYCAAC